MFYIDSHEWFMAYCLLFVVLIFEKLDKTPAFRIRLQLYSIITSTFNIQYLQKQPPAVATVW